MNIALLGATGFVGSALLKEALDRGHTVTAIVRHPEKLERRDRLVVKRGDVYDTALLATLDPRSGRSNQRVQPRMERSEPLRRPGSGDSVHHCRDKEGRHQASFVGRRSRRTGGQIGSARDR